MYIEKKRRVPPWKYISIDPAPFFLSSLAFSSLSAACTLIWKSDLSSNSVCRPLSGLFSTVVGPLLCVGKKLYGIDYLMQSVLKRRAERRLSFLDWNNNISSSAIGCFWWHSKKIQLFVVVQAVWITAVAPYILLIILLIRGLWLPGATDGILYFLTPQWGRLLETKVRLHHPPLRR